MQVFCFLLYSIKPTGSLFNIDLAGLGYHERKKAASGRALYFTDIGAVAADKGTD